ncbi:Outer membrane protein assembly factor BamB, contains PQQ-like beta-propeller repeat [Pseudarcicella hirudinis]|uniref:Outer membrane protein assembly factor BamB, contains PQQ-like beta-propeller repeat n=1 Tax=Pseudarcicella hirudinis TaxID=1079859 RepID=A0A1I5V173_9BACT|nr:PQQ-binding-like beta-propeller repeat protein [Pseudarcicella hirudinis]SFQ01231.1 Outer membrane protein assembly factor BamB, contains PQQ-like beta-propeller repeat [Pseudarcicella hirudinis]
MKTSAFIIFFLSTFLSFSQTEVSIPWAMFHGCEKHCGIYPAREFRNFGSSKWKFRTEGKIFSSPAVFNNVVYIGSEDKNLYAINTDDGKLKWKFPTDGAVHSSPAVFKNTVYFGSFSGYYYALDAVTGKEKWRFKTEGEKKSGAKGLWSLKPANLFMEDLYDFFQSSPVINMDENDLTLYFGSADGHLYAVDAENGKLKWKFKTNGIVNSSPTLYQGKVYIGSWDTYLYALDAKSGKEIWKFKTGDQPDIHLMEGIQASAVADDGLIYLGARDAGLYALNAENGQLVWKASGEGSWFVGTPAVKGGVLYIGTSDSYLMLALDAKTGQEKYRFKTKGYNYCSPALVGSTAYFGDFTGRMYALDLNSKGDSWHFFDTDSRKKTAAQILNHEGILSFKHIAKDLDHSLFSTTEYVMNQLYTLGPIVSSPAIKSGIIYFGSADGYLYAVNLTEEVQAIPKTNHSHH